MLKCGAGAEAAGTGICRDRMPRQQDNRVALAAVSWCRPAQVVKPRPTNPGREGGNSYLYKVCLLQIFGLAAFACTSSLNRSTLFLGRNYYLALKIRERLSLVSLLLCGILFGCWRPPQNISEGRVCFTFTW